MSDLGLRINIQPDNTLPEITLLDNGQSNSSQYGSLGVGYHTPDDSPRHGRASIRDVTPIPFNLDLDDDNTDLTNRNVVVHEAKAGWIRSGLGWLAETFLFCCIKSEEKADPSQALEMASVAYSNALQASDDRDAAYESAFNAAYKVIYNEANTVAALSEMGLIVPRTPIQRKGNDTANAHLHDVLAPSNPYAPNTARYVAYNAAIKVINIARRTAHEHADNSIQETIQDMNILTAVHSASNEATDNIISELNNLL